MATEHFPTAESLCRPTFQRFQRVVQQLLKLKEAGTLKNDELEVLLLYACSLFIEQEVDHRVQEVIFDKLSLTRVLGVL